MAWTDYIHPVAMASALALGASVMRGGLRMRRERLSGRAYDRGRHLLLGRCFVGLVAVGFAMAVASRIWIRGETALSTAHGWLSLLALIALVAGAALGGRLDREESPAVRSAHGAAAGLGLLVAWLAAVAGLSILP